MSSRLAILLPVVLHWRCGAMFEPPLIIDVVVELVEPKVTSLARALRKISEAGYIDEDAAREAIRRKGEFNFIDPGTGLKVDFWVMKEGIVVSREYKRRVNRAIDGRGVCFISPEDLILNKLKWHQYGDSALQLDDVKSILKASGGGLDYGYLKTWAKELEVLNVLESLGNF